MKFQPNHPRSSTRKFESTLEIAAPREAVWEALASAGGIRRWFAPEAEVRPGVGGEVRWSWGEAFDWKQTVEVWEPGKRLATRYDSPVEDGAGGRLPLYIDFELSGDGSKTTLRLVHSGFGPESDFDSEYDGISHGWPIELQSLRHALERHPGQERQLAWSLRDVEIDAAEAWTRLTGDGGIAGARSADTAKRGEAFHFTFPSGEELRGDALVTSPQSFAGIARSHGDAFLRIAVEDCAGKPQAWLWLATYGRPAQETEQLQSTWNTMLQSLFATENAGAKG